ncbi:HdeD family acid-resistance protein [Actinokineospora guangxiensis]|uniref:HdeD family acid-resistance protein n=1 Tax=Actinokineospora guangxiensis TaxID=1490288 RepID=A0ABW0EKX8_9PSEU
MIQDLARRWPLVTARGAVAILFGVIALVWPGVTLLTLVLLWAAYTVADGVIALVVAARGATDHRVAMGLVGLLGVGAGLVAFLWPGITALVLLVVIAAWAITVGVLQVVAAVRLRKTITDEWFLAVSGLLAIALGVLLLFRPEDGAVALVVTIAMFALLWGVALVLFGLRLRKVNRDGVYAP